MAHQEIPKLLITVKKPVLDAGNTSGDGSVGYDPIPLDKLDKPKCQTLDTSKDQPKNQLPPLGEYGKADYAAAVLPESEYHSADLSGEYDAPPVSLLNREDHEYDKAPLGLKAKMSEYASPPLDNIVSVAKHSDEVRARLQEHAGIESVFLVDVRDLLADSRSRARLIGAIQPTSPQEQLELVLAIANALRSPIPLAGILCAAGVVERFAAVLQSPFLVAARRSAGFAKTLGQALRIVSACSPMLYSRGMDDIASDQVAFVHQLVNNGQDVHVEAQLRTMVCWDLALPIRRSSTSSASSHLQVPGNTQGSPKPLPKLPKLTRRKTQHNSGQFHLSDNQASSLESFGAFNLARLKSELFSLTNDGTASQDDEESGIMDMALLDFDASTACSSEELFEEPPHELIRQWMKRVATDKDFDAIHRQLSTVRELRERLRACVLDMSCEELAACRVPTVLMRIFQLFLADAPETIPTLSALVRKSCNLHGAFKAVVGETLCAMSRAERLFLFKSMLVNDCAFFLRIAGTSVFDELEQMDPPFAAKVRGIRRSPRQSRRLSESVGLPQS